jgi:hypothetical protein
MSYAQFREIPPLDDIKELFTSATGVPFYDEVSWSSWNPVDTDIILSLRPYFRPSHQKILLETAQGRRPSCTLLRQLLRPYGYCIILYQKVWTMIAERDDTKTVGKKEGATIVWSG